MKNILFALPLFFILLGCSKSKKSNKSSSQVVISYSTNLNIGNLVYKVSNSSEYNTTTENYQWDGLAIYYSYPAFSAQSFGDYYQILAFDTSGGAVAQGALLQFAMPGAKNFSNYYSSFVDINIFDSTYTGSGMVSASITTNGNKTCNGSFSIQGNVISSNSTDSVSFSVSGNFTNAPYD